MGYSGARGKKKKKKLECSAPSWERIRSSDFSGTPSFPVTKERGIPKNIHSQITGLGRANPKDLQEGESGNSAQPWNSGLSRFSGGKSRQDWEHQEFQDLDSRIEIPKVIPWKRRWGSACPEGFVGVLEFLKNRGIGVEINGMRRQFPTIPCLDPGGNRDLIPGKRERGERPQAELGMEYLGKILHGKGREWESPFPRDFKSMDQGWECSNLGDSQIPGFPSQPRNG